MIKEYRVCMPLTVDEYQIGQLYMIAKHSAEQTDGSDGVEVIENVPCINPVHGQGQFTEKRIHLWGRLPAWIGAYVPKFIYLTEKAWNHYPYTETEYTCSIVPRFSIKIRTRYENNNGSSENCLDLKTEELQQRIIDHIDILTDPIEEKHVNKKEDPAYFCSEKTGRGPLVPGWKNTANPIMCSYKVINVSFQVFGLQTRVEELAHRSIRNVLLVSHRQAFAWIDEWYGMNINDVRCFETKMHLETNSKIHKYQVACAQTNNQVPDKAEVVQENLMVLPLKEDILAISSTVTAPCSPTLLKTPTDHQEKQNYLSSWFKWS